MKKIFNILALLLVGFAFVGCERSTTQVTTDAPTTLAPTTTAPTTTAPETTTINKNALVDNFVVEYENDLEDLLYTVEDMLAFVGELSTNEFSTTAAYVKGYAINTTLTETKSGSYYTFELVDTFTDTTTLTVYSCNLSEELAGSEISDGDLITVSGYYTKYQSYNNGPIKNELSGLYKTNDDQVVTQYRPFPTVLAIEHQQYALTTSVVDFSGQASTNATISSLESVVNSGSKVSFSINVEDGYEILSVKNGKNDLTIGEDEKYSFTATQSNDIKVVCVPKGSVKSVTTNITVTATTPFKDMANIATCLGLDTNLFTVTYNKNNAGTDSTIFVKNGGSIRLYGSKGKKGAELVFSITGGNIIKIEIDYDTADKTKDTAQVYAGTTLLEGNGLTEYEIGASSFTILNNTALDTSTAQQVRIFSITIYYSLSE